MQGFRQLSRLVQATRISSLSLSSSSASSRSVFARAMSTAESVATAETASMDGAAGEPGAAQTPVPAPKPSFKNDSYSSSAYDELAESMKRETNAARRHSPCHPYNMRMTKAASEQDMDGVLAVFDELMVAGVTPNIVAINHAMSAHARKGESSKAAQLLQTAEEKDMKPTIYTYNAAIRACIMRGELGKAEAVFRSIKAKGLVPDAYTFSYLMAVAGKASVYGRAVAIAEEMITAGVTPNANVYPSLIRNAVADRKPRSVALLLDAAVKQGIELDVAVYASAIALLAPARLAEPSVTLLKKIREKYSQLRLDIGLVIALLDCAFARRSGALLDEVVSMLQTEQFANVYDVTKNQALMEAVSSAQAACGRWAEAWETVNKFETGAQTVKLGESLIAPTLDANALAGVRFSAARSVEDLDRAYYALEDAVRRDVLPSQAHVSACLDALIGACVPLNDLDRAFATFDAYGKSLQTHPSIETFRSLLRVSISCRRLQSAEAVVRLMKERGLNTESDEEIQILLASGYARTGRLEELEKLVKRLEDVDLQAGGRGAGPMAIYRIWANKLAILQKPTEEIVKRVEEKGLDAASIKELVARVTKRAERNLAAEKAEGVSDGASNPQNGERPPRRYTRHFDGPNSANNGNYNSNGERRPRRKNAAEESSSNADSIVVTDQPSS
ncbi:mitochondrial pentatricopeptide repeat (PPR) protein [Andalucia godoyi]|uniref:Mitochondrial pentatricopeptide repeat (PPR) protein n=1 Tax=Andalucia godoyi TaxID=505711 RepID=A0A8K0AII6_ANDGO|nr:mitochondrial pentatricopeptide repeat (PPR) protein [Andalucia godoyi]|eukprot:ANDGO_03812.mRNA.1 mitochondrial pentatricopeptide repeat (PPR) protein